MAAHFPDRQRQTAPVTVTLAGGVTLTTTAGSNGAWSLTLPTKQIEGQLINVTATDAAGNASGTLGITAPVSAAGGKG
ncbi:large repetitive protein [Salmonella enterica subsp. enterica]|uniref:Large repetitive protein n=1 Tax=Salmonella enterica I TaxID=59201 RepID=A0A3S4F1Q3_SALET|nr:large repetitive protein [Salmonella enterica subsp. enterica]